MIHVGTCGFAYKDWIGSFYPATIRTGEMLPYYASCFRAVEIDASYYGVLTNTAIAGMLARTPADFRFCFKVPRSVSHPVEGGAAVHPDAKAFVRSMVPVMEAGKLGAVLIQFPNVFKPGESALDYLGRAAADLDPLPLIAEFRNRAWQTARISEFLERLGVGWCNVDEPQMESLMHPSSDVIGEVGYVRFHGRNRAQWWTGDNTTRYEYLYDAHELLPWADRVAEVADQARQTYVFFNNHARGNAARNAERFADLLRERYGTAADGRLHPRLHRPSQSELFE